VAVEKTIKHHTIFVARINNIQLLSQMLHEMAMSEGQYEG